MPNDLGATQRSTEGLGRAVIFEVRRSVGTPARKWLVVITVVLGLLAAVGLAATSPLPDRTFAMVSGPSQTLMSVTVPFLGILLIVEMHQKNRIVRLAPKLLAAVALAAVLAVCGVVICAVAIAIASSSAAADRWEHFVTIALASVLVQVDAQLIGTGLGLLLRRPIVAMIASIVLPIGLWLILGAVDALRPAQAWVTPFESATYLLSGQMSSTRWAQLLVVVMIWVVGLNLAGAIRLQRRAAT